MTAAADAERIGRTRPRGAHETLPWGRVATYGTAAVLLVLGLAVIAAPESVPGLVIPAGDPMDMPGAAGMPMR